MTDSHFSLQEFMALIGNRVASALDRWLPPANTAPENLHQAMRYSALAGGKYIRPMLVYATGRACKVDMKILDGPACAVELIHAYSLVHDDLPAMDDDDLRRGKPTCHNAFGEALAILAGDAMQALAFHILAHNHEKIAPIRRLKMIDTLAVASSSLGMAGGQAIDLEAVGKTLDLDELENMHTRKTGALIHASVLLGALSQENLGEAEIHHFSSYAKSIGVAFQIRDDILDVEGSTETLGKSQGADKERNKPTYPTLLGLDDAKQKAEEMYNIALCHLESFGPEADLLREISHYIINREN